MTDTGERSPSLRHATLPGHVEKGQIMGMPMPQPVTSIEELLALPDDGLRHELLDGDHVVTPAPSPDHQRVVGALAAVIGATLRAHPHLELFTGPADLRLSRRTLVQPDLCIIPVDPANRFRDWADAPVPLLAVEVLSPSTAASDRGSKRRLYRDAGVAEYWIVDIAARVVERWQQGDDRPEIVDGILEWKLHTASGSVNLPELFERAVGR
jgi:Uma2 family endonuclease